MASPKSIQSTSNLESKGSKFKQNVYVAALSQFFLLQETSVFELKAFKGLNEAHPYYRGKYALFKVDWL